MKKIVLLASCVLLMGATPALAAEGSGKAQKLNLLEKLDLNKDGKATKEENMKSSLEYFAKMDADKDGGVSFEEMMGTSQVLSESKIMTEQRAKFETLRKKSFEGMDVDKDGKISKDEYSAHVNERFTKMDMNKDGSIDDGDFEKYRAARAEARKAAGDSKAPKAEATPQ